MLVPVWIEHNVVKPNIYYLFYYNLILEEFESSMFVCVCVWFVSVCVQNQRRCRKDCYCF